MVSYVRVEDSDAIGVIENNMGLSEPNVGAQFIAPGIVPIAD